MGFQYRGTSYQGSRTPSLGHRRYFWILRILLTSVAIAQVLDIDFLHAPIDVDHVKSSLFS